MLAFQLTINGSPPRVYGFEDWSILTAQLFSRRNSQNRNIDDINFSITGLAEEAEPNKLEHVRFGRTDLQIGDKITIEIVEIDFVEKPIKRYRSDSHIQENPFTEKEINEMERQDYERLKAKFDKKS